MVTTIEEYNKQLEYVIEDIKQNILGGDKVNPPHFQTYNMDKPIYVFTANSNDYTPGLIDKGDHYEMFYPRFGSLTKTYTNNLAWVIDKHTVFCIERPFKNRVIRALKQLLSNDTVINTIKNDIIINGYKIGPTCIAGRIDNMLGFDNKPNSSLIYCLRWDDVQGLEKYFAGDPNYEARKHGKAPIGCLSDFIKNMTRLEFMVYLENFE